MKIKQTIKKWDDAGRPTDVEFNGDPATQCPGCLSTDVHVEGGVGWYPVGDRWVELDNMSPVRMMRCNSCHGRWFRPGLT